MLLQVIIAGKSARIKKFKTYAPEIPSPIKTTNSGTFPEGVQLPLVAHLYSYGVRLGAIVPSWRCGGTPARIVPPLTFSADSLFVQAQNSIDHLVNSQIICLNFHSVVSFP